MIRHLVVLLLAGVLALEASPDWDKLLRLKPGSTVEVTRTDHTRLRGKLVSASGGEVVVKVKGQGVAVPRADTNLVRVRVGRARSGNMLVGGAVVGGVFLGAGLGVAHDFGGQDAWWVAALFGAGGAVLGSAAAAFWRVSWRPVYGPAGSK